MPTCATEGQPQKIESVGVALVGTPLGEVPPPDSFPLLSFSIGFLWTLKFLGCRPRERDFPGTPRERIARSDQVSRFGYGSPRGNASARGFP